MACVERDLQDDLVSAPWQSQAHLPTDQFAQSLIQPGFGRLHSLHA